MPRAHRFGLTMLGWALNEEENVAQYIERAERFLSEATGDFELIFIDDGSSDRTWEIARAHATSRPWLRLYQNDRNRGSGYCVKRAVGLATKDYVFWQTVDWAYDIEQMGRSLHLLRELDILQGFRPARPSALATFRARSDNRWKACVSFINFWLVRLLFRVPFTDYQNVTVYPRALIQSIQLESDSSFVNPECLIKSWWTGATFQEIPVPFRKRQRGVAKGTRVPALAAAVRDIGVCWWRWHMGDRPRARGRGRIIRYEDSVAATMDSRGQQSLDARETAPRDERASAPR